MELRTAVRGRRSIRKYKQAVPPKEIIEEILKEALWAPSNMNRQSWCLVVVAGPKRDEVVQAIQTARARLRAELKERFPDRPDVVEATMGFFRDLGGAPVVILVYIPEFPPATEFDFHRISAIQSAAALTQNILLLAYERGLGTCYMTGPYFVREAVSEVVGMAGRELVAVVPIGYPDEEPRAPRRKEDVIHWIWP